VDEHLQQSMPEEVKLSLSGLDADKGLIDVRDLSRALEGWRGFWQISAAIYHNKELSTKPCQQDICPQIKIRAFERHCFDVVGQVIVPMALMVTYDLAKVLWKWRRALMRRHIDSKRKFFTREEALQALRLLARDYEIKADDTIETIKVMDTIDDALLDLTEPIDRSAKKISIVSSSGDSPIQLVSADRRALRSGYHVDPSLLSKGFEKCSVKFIRINTETGNSLIAFDDPKGLHQMGHEYSQIIDLDVGQPRNIYTRALYEGKSLEVWARMVRSDKTNNFARWEISVNPPPENTPLFEGQLGPLESIPLRNR
jgi:hypothetical protein